MSEQVANLTAASAGLFDPQDKLAVAWREAALGDETYEQQISEFRLIVNAARNTWPGRNEEFDRAIDVIRWTEFKEFESPVPEGMRYEECENVYLQITPEETLHWVTTDVFNHMAEYDSSELFKRRRRNEYAARDTIVGQAVKELVAATPMARTIQSIIGEQSLAEIREAPLSPMARIAKATQLAEVIYKEHGVTPSSLRTDSLATQRVRAIDAKLDNTTEFRSLEVSAVSPSEKYTRFLARLFQSEAAPGDTLVSIDETSVSDGSPIKNITFTGPMGVSETHWDPASFNRATRGYFYPFKGDNRLAETFAMQNTDFFRDTLLHHDTFDIHDWHALFRLWKTSAESEFLKYLYEPRQPGVVPLGLMPAQIPEAPVESILSSGEGASSQYISAEQQEKDKEKIVAEIKIEGKRHVSYFVTKNFTTPSAKREITESTALRLRSVRDVRGVTGFKMDRVDDAGYEVYFPYRDQRMPKGIHVFSGEEVQKAFDSWGLGDWASGLGRKKKVEIEDIEQYIIARSKYIMPETDREAQALNQATATGIQGVRFGPKRKFRRQKLEMQCSGASTLMYNVLDQLGVVARRVTGYSVSNGQAFVTEADAHQIVGVFTQSGEYYFDPTPGNGPRQNSSERRKNGQPQQRLNKPSFSEAHRQRVAVVSPQEIVSNNRTILLSQISEVYGSSSAADLFVRLKGNRNPKATILRETLQIISQSDAKFDDPEFVKVLEQKITSFENIKQATAKKPDKKRQAIVDEILPLLQSTYSAIMSAQQTAMLRQRNVQK